MKEPSLNERLKILVFGLFVPLLLFYIPYYIVLEKYQVEIFGLTAARAQFTKSFLQDQKEGNYRIENLFLGDSTAQTGFDPRAFDLRGVNLSLSGGSSMTANYIFKKFLHFEEAPKCVFYTSSYNWEQKYDEFFFQNIVFYDFFNVFDLSAIWRESYRGQVFPSSEYSYFPYMVKAIRYKAKLVGPPFNLMQNWLFREGDKKIQHNQRAVLKSRNRNGFLSVNSNRIPPESHFFRDVHQVYLKPFQAYASEDYFLTKLAESVTDSGARFYYVLFPVADSQYVAKAMPYIQGRAAHIRELFAGKHGVEVLQPFFTFDRNMMRDFSHPNKVGSQRLMEELQKLAPDCKRETKD